MNRGNAIVIGATGQIGRVAVRALAQDGWQVHALSRGGGRDERWPGDVRTTALDRDDDGALATALGEGADVLVDMVAYGAAHARQLAALGDRIGSAVVISSVAVYEDDQGRSLETQSEPDGMPRLPVPVSETQRTLPADDTTYGRRKRALEQRLLAAGEALPVTMLRAGAIHGPHSRSPRELWFVKRVLDGRRRRVLAYGGTSRFHPAHVSNIAELIRLAASRPGSRVLNAVDPTAPTVAEIGAGIDAAMGVDTETVLVDGPAPVGTVGETPWGTDRPLVMDMRAAERELGYRPVTGYVDSLPETVAWLTERLKGRAWQDAFPAMAQGYAAFGDLFDYAQEDAWLREHDRGNR